MSASGAVVSCLGQVPGTAVLGGSRAGPRTSTAHEPTPTKPWRRIA
ncbi:hypothetical protein SAMN05216553_113140 [Lentzea fradiae]|uniref:Uncharacterized protein n=1 Tax=Lentzea fradiae TaxID=200378 RepID=A0A1G7Y7V1_9PSEU|nr:hypothetical protein [Lentzea fradiae]SDG92528.1 hypothetical protein SAMN05216553_113140 [Lentzea fradiae]